VGAGAVGTKWWENRNKYQSLDGENGDAALLTADQQLVLSHFAQTHPLCALQLDTRRVLEEELAVSSEQVVLASSECSGHQLLGRQLRVEGSPGGLEEVDRLQLSPTAHALDVPPKFCRDD
jgi:hypothetical protein